ncbi:MAG: hypothetical protein ABDH53_09005, partial [Pseudothermotoga sp.]
SDTPEEQFLDQYGIPGLVFLYYLKKDYYSPEKMIEWLKNLTNKTQNVLFVGLIEALMGDTYLKMERLRLALECYKSAYRNNPLIAKFIKPIIEDLKTDLTDLNIEGVSDELWEYYTPNNDFIVPLEKYPKDELELVHLLSSHDFAKYVSAIATNDPKKKIELLNSISNPDLFKYYYYHLAKAYEKIDIETAYSYHIKAIETNHVLADIKEKKYTYTELYPAYTPKFYSKDDPKVWVGNLSERFSCQNIIQPVRAWKRSTKEGFLYAVPFPTEDALEIFLERERKTYGRNLMLPDVEFEEFMLSKVSWSDTALHCDTELPETYSSVLNRIGIELNEKSRNLLLICGAERIVDLEVVLKNKNEVILFIHLPNLQNREDEVWYYPGFVVLRSYNVLKTELEKLGFSEKAKMISGNLLGLFIKRASK